MRNLPQVCLGEDWVGWVSDCGAAEVLLHMKTVYKMGPIFSLKVLEPRVRGATTLYCLGS